MTVRIGSLETHYAIAAHRSTRLPVRTILGQWLRELGARNGLAVFPGPRRSPGNVTTAHAGRVCGHLTGGSATEQHRFPVFCTTTDGVNEYAWYFNHLSYYDTIATRAAGDWRVACNLIERSPWSSDHYGGTLDATAGACSFMVVRVTVPTANLRARPSTSSSVVARIPAGFLLAEHSRVVGQAIGGHSTWYAVRYGAGDGRIVYIHESVARPAAA